MASLWRYPYKADPDLANQIADSTPGAWAEIAETEFFAADGVPVTVAIPVETIQFTQISPAIVTAAIVPVVVENINFTQLAPTVTGKAIVPIPVQSLNFTQLAVAPTGAARAAIAVESVNLSQPAPSVQAAAVVPIAVESIQFSQPVISTAVKTTVPIPVETLQFSQPNPTNQTGALVPIAVEALQVSQIAPTAKGGSITAISPETINLAQQSQGVATGAAVLIPAESIAFGQPAPELAAGALIPIPTEQIEFRQPDPALTLGARADIPTENLVMVQGDIVPKIAGAETVLIPVETMQLSGPSILQLGGTVVPIPGESLGIAGPVPEIRGGAYVELLTELINISQPSLTVGTSEGITVNIPTEILNFTQKPLSLIFGGPKNFGMNKDLANVLKDKLKSLPFIDYLAGMVQTVTVEEPDQNNETTITKRFPVSYDGNIRDENGQVKELDLRPNSRYKTVIYFEDFGITIKGANAGDVVYQSSLRLVCWINRAKLVGDAYREISGVMIAMITRRLTGQNYQNTGIFTKLNPKIARIPAQDAGIFGRYTYNETERQYLRPPFDFFAIDFTIDFEVPEKCLSGLSIPWGSEICY